MEIVKADITGMVLAGGRGSRMGGIDKGLQPFDGEPLARHALLRLEPQVGALLVNANRHLDVYESWGVPVWPDGEPDYPGPLAGMASGLAHCATPYLVTVPCDAPQFPLDLVSRLAQALSAADGALATAYTRGRDRTFPQPVFTLMHRSVLPALREFIDRGERKVGFWVRTQGAVPVVFDDDTAFLNVNTLDELADAQRRGAGGSSPQD